MVPFDKGTSHFLVDLNGTREADGFASQSLDARSERQVVTLDTLGEYLPGQGCLIWCQELVQLGLNPAQTLGALKGLINSGEILGNVTEAVKQSYLARIETAEAQYQKAGASGSFNAGVEYGKLLAEGASLVAGGVGAIKGGALLTEKLTAKLVKEGVHEAVTAGSKGISHAQLVGLGRVENTYSAIRPGPLADNLAETFSGGRYTVVTLEKDTVLYRAGTVDQPLGQFFSSEPPIGVVQTRIDKAVLPEWPGGAKSPINTTFAIKIPAGTKVYAGEVGSQGGFYIGGSQQIVVQKPWLIDGVKVIGSSPLK